MSGGTWFTAATSRLEPIALAALSLGAAAIHFGVITEHYAEFAPFGAFFSLIGWFQALWAVAYVIRPVLWLAVVAIIANIATILVWVWAHVVGLPFGPDPGKVEPTTVTDLMATLFELLLISGLVWLSWTRATARDREPRPRSRLTAVVVLILVMTVALGTTVALAQGSM
jgi:small-conductance mechanosensitive channel